MTFSSLDDIIKSTHAIDAKGGRLPIGIPGRLQIGMHGRLRRYPQWVRPKLENLGLPRPENKFYLWQGLDRGPYMFSASLDGDAKSSESEMS